MAKLTLGNDFTLSQLRRWLIQTESKAIHMNPLQLARYCMLVKQKISKLDYTFDGVPIKMNTK